MAALEAIPVAGRVLSLSHAVSITAPVDGTAIGTVSPGTAIITITIGGNLSSQTGALIMFAMFVLNNTGTAAATVSLQQRITSSDGTFQGPTFMTITIPATSAYGAVWTYRAKTFPGARAADGRMDSTFAGNSFSVMAIASAAGVQTGTGNALSAGQAIVLLHIAGN